jgi:hypothetical protein
MGRATGLIFTPTYNFVTCIGNTSPLLTYVTLHGLKDIKNEIYRTYVVVLFIFSAARTSKIRYLYDLRLNAE